jgi:hypothetical protein
MNNLIALYEAWNKPEKAKEWRAKLPPAYEDWCEQKKRSCRALFSLPRIVRQ